MSFINTRKQQCSTEMKCMGKPDQTNTQTIISLMVKTRFWTKWDRYNIK